jgi:hypothetical protein
MYSLHVAPSVGAEKSDSVLTAVALGAYVGSIAKAGKQATRSQTSTARNRVRAEEKVRANARSI